MSTSRFAVLAVLVLAAIAGIFAVRNARAADDAVPAVGQQAPEFSLPSQEGTPVSLDHYRGKWVVLYFYPKDMTPGCTKEAHNFQADQEKYTKENAVILGVSVQSADSHKEFCTKENLTFRLLADTDKKVTKEYGSLAVYGMASRNTFLIDPSGKIVKVWTGVKPDVHSQEVLAELATVESKGM